MSDDDKDYINNSFDRVNYLLLCVIVLVYRIARTLLALSTFV